MFFGIQIIGKKQPLSNAWLLGCGRKVTKRKILKENVLKTCDMIISPAVPLALRLSAVLMSGVVAIHHQKQQYILEDAHVAVRTFRQRSRRANGERGASSAATTLRSRTTRTARTEDTVTLRSGGAAGAGQAELNEVSKHVEEIFLQEFLSTQPEPSGSLADGGSGSGRRGGSLEYFSSGSALRARESSGAPGLSLSHGPSRSTLEGSRSHQLEYHVGGETFLEEGDLLAGEGTLAAETSVGHQDDLMRDFFFTDEAEAQSLPLPAAEAHQGAGSNTPPIPAVDETSDLGASSEAAGRGEGPMQGTVAAAPKRRAGRKRRRDPSTPHVDRDSITLPRQTIRAWLRDASDIILDRPLLQRSGRGGGRGGSKRLRAAGGNASSLLRETCEDLRAIFEEGAGLGGGGGVEGNEDSGEAIEAEVLRQEDPSLSPRRVSDVAVFQTSSEEDFVLGEEEGQQDFLMETLPEILLPPTDEFNLPETDEAAALPRGDRQYENIGFGPLRLPTQPSQSQTQGSPHDYGEEARGRVLQFFRDSCQPEEDVDGGEMGGGGGSTTINFKDLMVSNQVRRPDVARVFFHTLVLHSRGQVEMAQARPGGDVLVSVAA